MIMNALPTTLSMGIIPRPYRESFEFVLLSPMTNSSPFGTTCFAYFRVSRIGLRYGSRKGFPFT